MTASAAYALGSRRTFILATGVATDTTAVGMADSSVWVPTAEYQRMFLEIKPNRPCRIAVAIYSSGDSLAPSSLSALTLSDTTKAFVWPWRNASATTADTLEYEETIAPTSVVPASYELPITFAALAAGKWGSPRGRRYAVRSPHTGEWYSGNFTRVRWRVLSAGGAVTFTVKLHGYSW